ncbi:tellurite resistance TerB family protein [Litchfieldella rifensis]|uniref:TerB family tellurite resistance protein n=1 Tax=Litchfieldella rifensis TaxID=762643 RepID=A0ABV7LSJ9_9GAMM
MLDAIQQFFHQTLADPTTTPDRTLTLELATAALLCEVIRADYHTGDAELAALKDMLSHRYHLSEEAVQELMDLAEQEVEAAVDHYQFVSLIKEHYGYDDRAELVRLMWELAYADDDLDPLEEHRIRRLADLLYVSHRDFIRAKLHVRSQ